MTDVAEQVLSGQPLALPDHVRLSAFGALITQCLNIDVEERPQTCDEAMCLLVESGLGGDETVQFSSAEALMRYEASRRSEPEQPARVSRTPAGTVETTLPAEIFDTPSEQPGPRAALRSRTIRHGHEVQRAGHDRAHRHPKGRVRSP